jgi:hypothetical protein
MRSIVTAPELQFDMSPWAKVLPRSFVKAHLLSDGLLSVVIAAMNSYLLLAQFPRARTPRCNFLLLSTA